MDKDLHPNQSMNNWTQLVVQILTIILLAVLTFYFYKLQSTLSDLLQRIEQQDEISVNLTDPPIREFNGTINIQNSPTLHDANKSKVVLIEFSDFECPFCAKASETVTQLQEDNKTVLFIHKDFPLKYHTQAEKAAVAARCAGEQGKYWEYYRLIYKEASFSEETYSKYAEEVGINIHSFETCIDDPEQLDRVKRDFEEGVDIKIDRVPLFIVGNFSIGDGSIQVQGAYYSADELAAAIDLYLNR